MDFPYFADTAKYVKTHCNEWYFDSELATMDFFAQSRKWLFH